MRFYDNRCEEHDTFIGATIKSGANKVGDVISSSRPYKSILSAMKSMYNRFMYGYDVYDADDYDNYS